MKQAFLFLFLLSVRLFGQTSIPDTNNYSLEIKEQTALIEKSPVNWEAYYKRGNYKLALKQYKEAVKDYNKAIEIHAKNDSAIANTFNNRGTAKCRLGNYVDALLDYKAANILSPKISKYKANYITTKEVIKNANLNDNYYDPWHQKIRDTISLPTVSKAAFYLFGGFGVGTQYTQARRSDNNSSPIIGYMVGCSVAYKSHLITVDRIGVTTVGETDRGESFYKSNYTGVLLGESVRYKHFLFSLSAGIANTYFYETSSFNNPNASFQTEKQAASIPIEFKFNWLAKYGGGAGFQISYNIVPSTPYSCLYFHTNFVLGRWNKK